METLNTYPNLVQYGIILSKRQMGLSLYAQNSTANAFSN